MSYLLTSPELVTTAAAELEAIGASISTARAFAAPSTSGVLAAAGDDVSAAVADVFSTYGTEYQRLMTQAAAPLKDSPVAMQAFAFLAGHPLATLVLASILLLPVGMLISVANEIIAAMIFFGAARPPEKA